MGYDSYFRKNFHESILKITGPEPIDLNSITPETECPALIEVKEPAPEPPPLPTKRVLGASYFGFTGVCVHFSGHSGSTAIGDAREHRCGFHLPFKTVVRRAGICVDVPQGKCSIRVALKNATTNEEVCTTTIDASQRGDAEGFFEETAILAPNDYYLTWQASDYRPGLSVKSIGNSGVPVVRFGV